jgi:DNA polymerase-3 subunit alpha
MSVIRRRNTPTATPSMVKQQNTTPPKTEQAEPSETPKVSAQSVQWVSLHTHTDYSLLDGMGKCDDYVKRAKELGMPAIAITDHGTMSGAVEFYSACKKEGIKPLIGSEFYEAPESRFIKGATKDSGAKGKTKDDSEKEDRYNHIVLIAKNETGYKNLCYLTTRANTEGFYAKPRIDFELLKEHHEGIICLSGCVAGRIPKLILRGEMDEAIKWAKQYKEVFGDDFYLEVQNHGLLDEQRIMAAMPRISREAGVKMVATNDCHYVRKEDSVAHEWLLCKQTQTKISDPNHLKYEGDYSLLSPEEMKEKIPFGDAVENTLEIAEKCDFDFTFAKDAKDYYMPKVVVPAEYEQYGDDKYNKYMEALVWEGYEKRYPIGHALRDAAKERIEYELGIIKKMGFAEYFLDTRKTIFWAKEHNIVVGAGRGSGAGSAVNYCLGITDLEPIKYGLLFERFLNPDRVSMPDIDVDYEKLYKDDVIKSEADSNGIENFAKIRTFGTLKAKQVIRDMGSVAGLEQAEINKFAKLIPKNLTLVGYEKQKNGQTVKVEGAWETSKELRDFVDSDPKYRQIWDIAVRLEGTKKSASTHACGHIPTPVPCEQLFPCAVDKKTGYLVCEYSMSEAEHLGLLKKDLLMLRNLAIIDIAHASIKAREGKDIPLWTEDILNDKEALDMICQGETYGVFQLESDAMANCMKNLKPKGFEDITAGVALYRPGPMQFIPDYIKGKEDPSKIVYDDPRLKPILEPTYGVFVYQEQIMQAVQALAGFTKGEADMVRKAMGKKIDKLMNELGDKFRKQAVENGLSADKAASIWNKMADFGKYAFNKSHAAAYSCISMQTAYLKRHYPIDFYAGLLTSEMDKRDLLVKHIKDCREKGIEVCPPDVNNSSFNFTAGENKIFYGLTSINKIGKAVAQSIVKEREENGEFKSFVDFRKRMMDNGSGINSGAIKNLIRAGAFDWTGYNRPTLEENLPAIDKALKKTKGKPQVKGQMSLFDVFDDSVTVDNYNKKSVPNGLETAQKILDDNIKPDLDRIGKLRAEKDATGFYISGHPMEDVPVYEELTNDKLVSFASIIDVTGKKASIDFSTETEEEEDVGADYGLEDDAEEAETNAAPIFEADKSEDIEPKYNDKDYVTVQGIIVEMREIITKNNQAMGFVNIEDEDGNILKVTAFPQLWTDGGVKQNFKEDDIVTVLGQVSSYKGEFNLTAKFIENETEIKDAIYIDCPDSKTTKKEIEETADEIDAEVRSTLAFNRVHTPPVLHPIYLRLSDEQMKVCGYKSRYLPASKCNNIDDFIPTFKCNYGTQNVYIQERRDVSVTAENSEVKKVQNKDEILK